MKMRTATIAKRTFTGGLAILAALVALLALTGTAFADTLELRSGQIIQGKFVGGSAMNIRFQVNGQEQIFATKDVLNIGFSDSGDASNAAPPPQAASVPPPAPSPAALPDAPRPQVIPAAPAVAAAPAAPQGPPTATSVTIPAGTTVLVRMIDGIDSSQNRVGDMFHASLESALVVGDVVVAPKGADAYGKLTQAKEAGKISGGAQLTLELTGIRIGNNIVPVESTDYDVAGKGRGTQSAERIGGGAVLGTIIGAIAGGGKGAAIGAVAGAGTGTAVQVLTHGDQVRIPSETLLEFTLQQDVTAPIPGQSN